MKNNAKLQSWRRRSPQPCLDSPGIWMQEQTKRHISRSFLRMWECENGTLLYDLHQVLKVGGKTLMILPEGGGVVYIPHLSRLPTNRIGNALFSTSRSSCPYKAKKILDLVLHDALRAVHFMRPSITGNFLLEPSDFLVIRCHGYGYGMVDDIDGVLYSETNVAQLSISNATA